jgi:hypothetical protein
VKDWYKIWALSLHDFTQSRFACDWDSVARAFHEIYFLERACQIQVKALSSATLHYPSPKVCEHTLQQFENPMAEPIIQAAWQAALSLIEDQQSDYCR